MKAYQCSVFGVFLVATLAGVLGAENCTENDILEHVDKCKTEHIVKLAGPLIDDMAYTDFDTDPMVLWDNDELCSNSDEVSKFFECVFEARRDCYVNTSMEGSLPAESKMQEAVETFCEKKEEVLETLNTTEVQSCVDMKKPTVLDCMNKNLGPSDSVDCVLADKFATCMQLMSECTGEVELFYNWGNTIKPEVCGACVLSTTISLLLLGILLSMAVWE